MEEKGEYIVVSQKELEEADELLKSIPPVTIELPHTVLEGGTEQGFVERRQSIYVKFSITFLNVMSELKGSRLSVFVCLILHIDENNKCFPSIDTIAKETGYSSMQVMRAIKSLEENGFLTIERKHRRSNIYQVDYFAAFGRGNDPEPLSNKMLPKTDNDKSLGNMGVTQDVRNVTQNGVLGNMGVTPTRKNQLKQEPILSAKNAQNENFQQPSIEDTINENDVLFGEEDERDKRTDAKHVERAAFAIAKGMSKAQRIRVEIEHKFAISPNWGNKNWSKCLTFLKGKPDEETVEIFASWWWNDNWLGSEKQQPPRADQIMELWPQAFTPRKEQDVYSTLPKITSETKFN